MNNFPDWPAILNHILTSVCCFFIMFAVGGSLGYLIARLTLRWGQKYPTASRFLTLIPWRSIVIFIAILLVRNPFFTIFKLGIGIGSKSEYLIISLALTVLFIPWIARALLNRWQPGIIKDDVVSISRTFLILSLAMPVFLFTGVGNFIEMASSNGEYAKVLLGNITVGLIMLGADLLFGGTKCLLERSSKKQK